MQEKGVFDPKTGLTIYPERDNNLKDFGKTLLENFYLKEHETIQSGFARASLAWSNGDTGLAQRLYDYVSKGWFMFASPVLSNAPEVETLYPLKFKKNKGLPISCFLTYVPDSITGLIEHTMEERWLSVLGGGVGAAWSDVRSVSDKSPGPIPFLHTVDSDMEAYHQGKTRRGSYAAYMDISHPDIVEFLNIRVPTGDISRKCHSTGFHNAINITDDFMIAVLENKKWDLIDPASKKVKNTISALELWNQIMDVRYRTGEPYLYYIDEANRQLPWIQKFKGLKTNGSNLCAEISLATDKDRTAVCCLSSLNLEHYEDWKDTTIIEDLIVMLDNVIQYFVDNAPDELHRARYSAMMERSLGLGAMGFHHLLQKNNISFESMAAINLNKEIFSTIQERAIKSSRELAKIYGECPDMISVLTLDMEDGSQIKIGSSDIISVIRDGNTIEIRAFEIQEEDDIILN